MVEEVEAKALWRTVSVYIKKCQKTGCTQFPQSSLSSVAVTNWCPNTFCHITHRYSQIQSTRATIFPNFLCEWTLVVWALNWPNARLNKVNKVIGTNHNCDPVWLTGWHQHRSLVSIAPCWSTWRGSLPSLFSPLALAPWALWLVKVIGV